MKSLFGVLVSESTLHSIGIDLLQQMYLAGVSLIAAILVAVPAGILLANTKRTAQGIINVVGILQTIPSLALLSFMIPVFGVGAKPAIVALFIYALLPIISSTYSGLRSVDAGVIEAAKGVGMTRLQILTQVEFPLAIRVIANGIRMSAVLIVGWATLGSFIGAGGLGNLIFEGLSIMSNGYIVAGALPTMLLALVLDWILGKVEWALVPVGLRLTRVEGDAGR